MEDSKRKELQREEKSMAELNDLLKSEEDLIASTEKDVNEARENLDKEIAACNEKLEALKAKEAEMSEGMMMFQLMIWMKIFLKMRILLILRATIQKIQILLSNPLIMRIKK